MYDDDFDDSGEWGYNGDAEHDMWVDYTTDMYEDTDYSGENPDYDVDWEAEYETHVDDTQHSHHHSPTFLHHQNDNVASMTARQYENRIHRLEGLIAAAIAAATVLDTKSANATSVKNIRKYQRRASEKQSEVKKYQDELTKLKANYKTAKLESEKALTRIITIICVVISIIAILVAICY